MAPITPSREPSPISYLAEGSGWVCSRHATGSLRQSSAAAPTPRRRDVNSRRPPACPRQSKVVTDHDVERSGVRMLDGTVQTGPSSLNVPTAAATWQAEALSLDSRSIATPSVRFSGGFAGPHRSMAAERPSKLDNSRERNRSVARPEPGIATATAYVSVLVPKPANDEPGAKRAAFPW